MIRLEQNLIMFVQVGYVRSLSSWMKKNAEQLKVRLASDILFYCFKMMSNAELTSVMFITFSVALIRSKFPFLRYLNTSGF